MRRSFTLTETLLVIGIIAIVTALSYPAFSAAKERAQLESCMSNLKQIHLAIKMYQSAWDGEGKYGDMYEMGLPFLYGPPGAIELPKWECAGLPNEFRRAEQYPYNYFPAPDWIDHRTPTWKEYAASEEENSILICDPNHNPKDVPLMFESKFHIRAFGVRLSGQAVRRTKKGMWYVWSWWK